MRQFLRSLFRGSVSSESLLEAIHRGRWEFAQRSDADLKSIAWRSMELPKVFALTAVIASRVLGLNMFDVQLEGARALASGKIAEMQVDRAAVDPTAIVTSCERRKLKG